MLEGIGFGRICALRDQSGLIGVVALAGATTLAAGLVLPPVEASAMPASGERAHRTASTEVFSVDDYGASTSSSDNTAAFKAAIAAAQAAGPDNEVYVPPGTYDFSTGSPASIQIDGTVPVILSGDTATDTTLVELTRRRDLLSIKCDGATVQDLTFNTQTYDGGHAIGSGANDTTVQDVDVYSGTLTFGIYFPGPPGAKPSGEADAPHSQGNVVDGVVLDDELKGDGFSYSFQNDGSVSDVTQTGSHITLYADTNVQVDDYTYHPGNYGSTSGWVISSPCDNVTITNFTSYGFGGQIREVANHDRINQDITIDNEQMLGPTDTGTKPNALFIGDVEGLTIENSALQQITIEPRYEAQGSVTNTTYTKVVNHPGKAEDDITFSS